MKELLRAQRSQAVTSVRKRSPVSDFALLRGTPGRASPRCSESVKLKGELHRSRRSTAFRIRQAKGELHRSRRKLKGELYRSRRSTVFRIRQAKGELHRSRRSAAFRIHQAKGELHRSRRSTAFRMHQAEGEIPPPLVMQERGVPNCRTLVPAFSAFRASPNGGVGGGGGRRAEGEKCRCTPSSKASSLRS